MPTAMRRSKPLRASIFTRPRTLPITSRGIHAQSLTKAEAHTEKKMVMLHEYDDDVEGARIEQRPSKRDLAIAGAIYLCISSFSMLAAWTGGFSFRSINPFGDANQYEWSFAWVAHAIATGQAPWYSSMLYHPHGVNLLANPAPFAISLVASPITWIFGPMEASSNCGWSPLGIFPLRRLRHGFRMVERRLALCSSMLSPDP